MRKKVSKFLKGVVCSILFLTLCPLQQIMAKEQAYYQILDDIVQEYGICEKEFEIGSSGQYYTSGLVYAKLLDFNNNGTDELLTLTSFGGYDHGSFFDRYLELTLELWSFDTGEAVRVYDRPIYRDGSFHSSGKVDILQRSDGTYYMNYSESGGGTAHYHYLLLENGKMVDYTYVEDQVTVYSDDVNYGQQTIMKYFLNGNPIPVNEFMEGLDSFDGDRTKELLGGGNWLQTDISLYYDLKTQYYYSLDLEEILEALPYTGDISKMHLTAEQALAMADQMEIIPDFGYNIGLGYYYPITGMFDRGDGIPSFLTMGIDFQEEREMGAGGNGWEMWRWNQESKQIERVAFPYENVAVEGLANGYTIFTISVLDTKTLVQGTNVLHDFANIFNEQYSLKDGLFHEVENYSFAYTDYYRENLQEHLQSILTAKGYKSINIDISHMIDDYVIYIVNGVSLENEEEYYEFSTELMDNGTLGASNTFKCHPTGNWANGYDVATLLRAYAEKADFRYSFPDLSQKEETTSLFSTLNLKGTLKECYEIVKNYYYVIMEENGLETGYCIKVVKIDGTETYLISAQSTDILEEEQLIAEGNDYLHSSNVSLAQEEIKNCKSLTDYVTYFQEALKNIAGIQLNDAGKSDVSVYMQDSLVDYTTSLFPVTEDIPVISWEVLAPEVEKSNNMYESYENLLETAEEFLNKALEQCVRIILQGANEENWTIYLDASLKDKLGNNHLQIFLDSGEQGIELSPEDLNGLLDCYEGLFINVQKTGEEQYAISFADSEGNSIEKLEYPVKIFLPTDNEFATVMLEYAHGTENWGGQFNSNTIQFSTIYTGTYLIIDNSVVIPDVSEDILFIIQFMVSKGFFDLDDLGNFNPDGTITRNEFTETLVSMFFALDRDLKTSFPDVMEDSPYYSYIASGESRQIVAGFNDGLFHGETNITEEMVFLLISQTLVDKKGYFYPEQMDTYLDMVTGGTNSSAWAENGVALCIRDAIISLQDEISPTTDISRSDATVYLYRLFMLLEEKQDIHFEIQEETVEQPSYDEEGSSSNIILPVLLGLSAVVGGALWYKNKTSV